MSVLSKLLPYPLRLLKLFRKIRYRGKGYYCPICQTSLQQFLPYGVVPRPNALCPVCRSVERHRMIWLYFSHETNLFSSHKKKMLHIAPELCFIDKLSRLSQIDYLTADLTHSAAMVKMDITDIQYPDNSFDVIYCSHVLEHVHNDKKAMQEFVRILRPNGWAILQVPIDAEKTFEDPTVTDPKERERIFGQHDHVRVYGYDYKERLEELGFIVKVVPYLEQFDHKERQYYGLNIPKDDIFFCTLQ